MRALVLPALLYAAATAGAELGGAKIDERASVGGAQLQLNGAGLRTRMVFDVYAIGLYLPKKTTSAKDAIAMPGPKRLQIHMLRDVGADQFTSSLIERLHANTPEPELKPLQPRIQDLVALMRDMKHARKGADISLDWTGSALVVSVDGKPAGKPIVGEDLYRAVLRIWIGEHPGQLDLKRALLGQK